MTNNVIYVADMKALRAAVDQCLEQTVVAVDTEFARFNTYYPIVGLVQLFDGETCYLIDPLEVPDLDPLCDLFAAEEVVKVFHSGSEDMEVFQPHRYAHNILFGVDELLG